MEDFNVQINHAQTPIIRQNVMRVQMLMELGHWFKILMLPLPQEIRNLLALVVALVTRVK